MEKDRDELERLRRQLVWSKAWSRQLASNLADAHCRIISLKHDLAKVKTVLKMLIVGDANYFEPGGFDDVDIVRMKAKALLAELEEVIDNHEEKPNGD